MDAEIKNRLEEKLERRNQTNIVVTGKDFILELERRKPQFYIYHDAKGTKIGPISHHNKFDYALERLEEYVDSETFEMFFHKFIISSGTSVRVINRGTMVEGYVHSPFINLEEAEEKTGKSYNENLQELLGIVPNSCEVARA